MTKRLLILLLAVCLGLPLAAQQLPEGLQVDTTTIVIRDNGIDIEDTIINKIFDPFFTTKTTGEAAGVGLYLTHEVIQNYRGDITVKSVKDEFCEFTITLPAIKK